jgi:hypothetical protein
MPTKAQAKPKRNSTKPISHLCKIFLIDRNSSKPILPARNSRSALRSWASALEVALYMAGILAGVGVVALGADAGTTAGATVGTTDAGNAAAVGVSCAESGTSET